MRCETPASVRWPRCTTGICRPRSTIAAAGSTARSRSGSPTTPPRRSARSTTARGGGGCAGYAAAAFRALDAGVEWWATLNEPWVVTDGGYLHGALAPGHANLFEAPLAPHNLLPGHGRAVGAPRAPDNHGIGIVLIPEPKEPASDSAADLAATRRADA